jgi:hypothetical protein
MVMDRQMYFGTKELMSFVPAPTVDYDASRVGWVGGVQQFLNGFAWNKRSVTTHKTYNFTWSNLSRDQIRLIRDYADGIYGTGAIYFLDPFAMDRNLLPQHWATPRLVEEDGPVLTGQQREDFVMYPTAMPNQLGYPQVAPYYNWDSTTWPAVALRPSVYIPLPEGYTLWFGAHGVVTAAATSALTILPDSGTVTQIQILDVTNNQRFSNSWDSTTTTGITINFGAVATSSAAISGMMVQVLPTGVTPATGGFISGQGNGGVSFVQSPQLQEYSAALDLESLTAVLVEDSAFN